MTKKRNLIYLAIVLSVVFGVLAKQRSITRERNEKIVSLFSEWQEHGKPVVIFTAEKSDVPLYTKVTFWQTAPDVFVGQVSKTVRDQLKTGQNMLFKVDGLAFQGEISDIADEISFDTGMYLVSVTFEKTFDISGWHVAYAHTGTLRDVINIPNEMIERVKDRFFVWKIENGKAVKRPIAVRQKNGYGAIVENGIKEGDKLVLEGSTRLREEDKVNVIREL